MPLMYRCIIMYKKSKLFKSSKQGIFLIISAQFYRKYVVSMKGILLFPLTPAS